MVIAAAKLCQAGFTQKAAAEMLGIHPRTVSDWFVQYGADNFLPGKVCEYCQKSLAGYPALSRRKYCSASCYNRAKYQRTHKPSGRMKFDPALRARGLELYWGGLSQKAISDHLCVARGTVCSWIHDFGSLRQCNPVKEILALRPPEERLQNAENPREWREALGDLSPDKKRGEKSVHLVCERILGHCGMNKLATIITDKLHLDPMSGKIYAFCDTQGIVVSTICWDGVLFKIGKYPKIHGAFLWPECDWGQTLSVRESEFETLLSYCQIRGVLGRKLLKNQDFYDIIEA